MASNARSGRQPPRGPDGRFARAGRGGRRATFGHVAPMLCAWLALASPACQPAPGSADGGEDRRGDRRAGGDRLLVGAASDLALAMPELVEAFARETGIRLDVTLGSSGQIAHQIANGAPIDVFLSADAGWVDRLRERGRVADGSTVVYAIGPLALAMLPGTGPPVRGIADLARPEVRRIAIANPEHAPYGRAAQQALERAGLWQALAPKVVFGENVRQAIQYVEAGAADVAIGARSLVRESRHRWVPVPADLHDPLEQTAAAIAGRPDEDGARAFLRFVAGDTARAILTRHGFDLPASSSAAGSAAPDGRAAAEHGIR